MRLYEIPAELAHLEDLLIESAGELTPEIDAAVAILHEAGADLLESAACALKHLTTEAEALKAESDRLAQRAHGREKAAALLRKLMLPALVALGGKVKTPRFTLYTTTRKTPKFDLKPGHEIYELPPRFFRARDPELNNTELKKAVEAGEALPEFLIITTIETTSLAMR